MANKLTGGMVVCKGGQHLIACKAFVTSPGSGAKGLRFGDALVCAMTDQDMMPIMSQVSVILTQEGGTACHAAIIARELNIPCITSIPRLLQTVEHGMRLTADMDTGKVTVYTDDAEYKQEAWESAIESARNREGVAPDMRERWGHFGEDVW